MGKPSKKATTSSALPLTPILYINDPQFEGPNIDAISAVIPSTSIITRKAYQPTSINDFFRIPASKETVLIIADNQSDDDHGTKISFSYECKTASIKHGCNFASINLYLQSSTPPTKLKDWGTNHLDLCIARLAPEETADKVYKWLCTFPTIPFPLGASY